MPAAPTRVLLIDDDEDEHFITRDLLRSAGGEGITLDWVPTFDEGLRSILSGDFDVGLVDYRLGEHDGLELIAQAVAHANETPLILLTGEGDRDVDLRAMRSGASDYLAKAGLTSALLERAIRYAVERGHSVGALRKATQAAEASARAKSAFLASMSHEIRTPMNSILGMAELLWATDLDDTQKDYVGRFRRAGKTLLALIDDILDLSKIESGRFELEAEPFSLWDVLAGVTELNEARARAKNVRLSVQASSGMPGRLIGDSIRLEQILNNLVGNAVKFTERGSVVLSVGPRENSAPGHLQFAVQDTGIGIPAEQVSAIFEDFTQAESSTTRRFGGTGLGLGISRRLVERMGGTLSVKSEDGVGSIFHFDVVLQADRKSPVGTVVGTSAGAAAATGSRQAKGKGGAIAAEILVAEDSADNRYLVQALLRNRPYMLTFAENGKEAVEFFSRRRFDIVLMDIQMPVMDGLEATRRIRAIEQERSIRATPILAVTANAMAEDREKSAAAGCDAHLAKPISMDMLVTAISSHLPTRPAAS